MPVTEMIGALLPQVFFSVDAMGSALVSLVQKRIEGVDHGRMTLTHSNARYLRTEEAHRDSQRSMRPPALRLVTCKSHPIRAATLWQLGYESCHSTSPRWLCIKSLGPV